jgi:hypothetical protein
MAQLAIRGHATRGKEVIEILEMLGGKQFESYNGNDVNWCYTIIDGAIDWDYASDKYKVFSLEEFIEKFPYKIGDKIYLNGDYVEITGLYWNGTCNEVNYEGVKVNSYLKYDCLSVQDIKPCIDDKSTCSTKYKINFKQYINEHFNEYLKENLKINAYNTTEGNSNLVIIELQLGDSIVSTTRAYID